MAEADQFVVNQVEPLLQAGESIRHFAYLTETVDLSDRRISNAIVAVLEGVSAFRTAARQRACFIALSEARAFFLWGKPGRVGAFRPLLEHEHIECWERNQIDARVERLKPGEYFKKKLVLSFSSGERVAFELKKRVAGMPGQVACINALLGRPTFW
ncbi:MAG: hypothetical protein N838_03790 [Thiohalocapsa sp. PB-PSB1]|jgi:hypothetical protein|nr:MAG: hypothetical protein N838_07960 [Thiohalocapsa sp. PB-PSB1]QQO52621.1 MAG: hypothetical protein N838_03790 [Thiohalocapsa sp. PB-PSB1]HCS90232.1 hypothetical protein [Chromatiaceae bacterium]